MKRPFAVSLALSLIVLVAVLWALFGMVVAIRLHPALPDQPVIRWGMALASFMITGVLLSLWMLLNRRSRWAYWLTIALMGGLFLAAFLDDVGWADLAFVGLCILELG